MIDETTARVKADLTKVREKVQGGYNRPQTGNNTQPEWDFPDHRNVKPKLMDS